MTLSFSMFAFVKSMIQLVTFGLVMFRHISPPRRNVGNRSRIGNIDREEEEQRRAREAREKEEQRRACETREEGKKVEEAREEEKAQEMRRESRVQEALEKKRRLRRSEEEK